MAFVSERQRKHVMAKLNPEARKFISRKIKKNISEGKPQKQSIAIAYSQARKKGFEVQPFKPKKFPNKRL